MCKTNWSSLTNTLTHELGHVLGFDPNEHRGQVVGVSSHCAMYLPDDHSINSTVCQHEVEKVYAAYGIVPWSGTPTNFYGRHIVTGVNATPSSVSLVKGESATISVTRLLFARGAIASADLGSVGLTWTSDAIEIAKVSNGVITTAENTGSTTVRVKVSSSLPSTYQLGGLMARHGTEIAVTVTPPPPPGPGFRVSDITGVPKPITSAGTYTFQAQVVTAAIRRHSRSSGTSWRATGCSTPPRPPGAPPATRSGSRRARTASGSTPGPGTEPSTAASTSSTSPSAPGAAEGTARML